MTRSLRLLLLAGSLGLFASAPGLAQDGEGDGGVDGASPASEGGVTEEVLDETETADDAAAEYGRRLLTVEEEVNTLKERVFRSKATLQLLKEIVIQGSSTGSRAVLWHVNELGPTYTVESVSYYLDGQSVYAKADPNGSLDAVKELKIWDGAIPPGNHNLTVNLVLRGNGFGVFSYVEGYTFKVQSSYAFVAEDGNTSNVRVVLDERKGVARSFVERPNVEYELKAVRLLDDEG